MKAAVVVNSVAARLTRAEFLTGDIFDEAWLQDRLFQSPDLLNFRAQDELDPIVPVCRELPLRGASRQAFVDIFAVRAGGTPVLIECKLWRNPQSRREVIGQILEYAALLKGFAYSDLQGQLKQKLGQSGFTDLWNFTRSRTDKTVSEQAFVDRFTSCLQDGSFDLIITGDGIRSDVKAVVDLLEHRASAVGRLSLLELTVWTGLPNTYFVTAQSPLDVHIQRQRIAVSGADTHHDDEVETAINRSPTRNRDTVARDRAFWERFIQEVEFNHPDQEKPRHAGQNWVKVPFPPPAEWITCYRTRSSEGRIGVFMTLRGDRADDLCSLLYSRRDDFEKLIPGLQFHGIGDGWQHPEIACNTPANIDDATDEPRQRKWFALTLNAFVDAFRPALAEWNSSNE